MNDINNIFEHRYQSIASSSFLKMEALGGEIPFYIAAYEASDELENRKAIKGLVNKLETSGVNVLEVNLYDMVCDIIENRRGKTGGMERMFKTEKAKTKDKFLSNIQSSLNIHKVLIPAIAQQMKESNARVYFLTGIGLVFPYIRSHTILNNLQNIAKDAPTVIFFPGKYDGESLNLFGKFKDDNYYRAFDIDNIKI